MLADGAPPVEGCGSRASSVRVAQNCQERLLRAASVPFEDVRGGYTGPARKRVRHIGRSYTIRTLPAQSQL